ncbi:MAG: TIGR03435 family protein [Acidobacteriia bacterium]|nr:TIGR03435 family protein [Terriglobia bacterium]
MLKRLTLAAPLLVAFAAFAGAQARPEFEVASVRIVPPGNNSESYMQTLDVGPGGTLRISNRRLDEIIMVAYNISGRQLSGPRWLTEPTTDPTVVTRYEIVAKVPDDAKKDQIPLMLQKLLEDRFKLQVHRESRTTQVYALGVAKGGPKLETSVPNGDRPPGCARVVTGGAGIGAAADCYHITAEQLAHQLPSLSPAYFRDGPVVDRTGLTGTYDLHLEWMMQQQLDAGLTGPTMFTAVEKLGLTLEKKRDTAEMLIVDHCEPTPTEN